MTSEELKQALTLILERRRISYDLLNANFGSAKVATDLLCLLETNDFISKPLGSNRWEIHYDKIEKYLENPTDIQANNVTIPTTIKKGGLKELLNSNLIAHQNFNIANILTTDLTVSEIDNSLEQIEQSQLKINKSRQELVNLNRQQLILKNKKDKLKISTEGMESKIAKLNTSITNINSNLLIMIFVSLLVIVFGGCFYAYSNKIPVAMILLVAIPIIVFGFIFALSSINKKNLSLQELLNEKEGLDSILKSMYRDKQVIENEEMQLQTICDKNTNSTILNAKYTRISELKDILVKMKSILADTNETQTNRVLALEKLIYFLNKKHSDSQLFAEQQKATDYAREQAYYAQQQANYAEEQAEEAKKQVQATKDLEEAIRKQTEFQAYVEIMKDIEKKGW